MNAKYITGYILNRDNDGKFVFRVYGEVGYTDYELCTDSLLITIEDYHHVLKDGKLRHKEYNEYL